MKLHSPFYGNSQPKLTITLHNYLYAGSINTNGYTELQYSMTHVHMLEWLHSLITQCTVHRGRMTRIVTRSRGYTSPCYCKETLPAFMKLALISLIEINFTSHH
jgi:hypothetical protein